MARLNSRNGNVKTRKADTVNLAGGEAFSLENESKLFQMVSSRLYGEGTYYQSADLQDAQIIGLVQEVGKTNPKFVLQLAAYCRNVLNLRTISQVLLVEASLIKECQPYVRSFTPVIVRRADELKEVLAYLNSKIGHIGNGGREGQNKNNSGSFPMALKKGLRDTFGNFNAYQLAKYNGGSGTTTLKDVLRLVHPKPKTEEQSKIYYDLLHDSLPIPETWETTIPNWKSLGYESKKAAWEAIIPKMGYMALLRNLRNFLEEGVDVQPVIDKLIDPEQVKRSKQIPFRFLSAYAMITHANAKNLLDRGAVLEAIERAMELSIENVPEIKGDTFSSADNSGSMGSAISEKSTVARSAIANTLQSILYARSRRAIASVFGTEFHTIVLSKRAIMQNIRTAQITNTGSSTNGYLTVQYLNRTGTKVDRIVIFTDEEVYGGSLNEELRKYRRHVNPDVFVYIINVAGYGTSSVNPDNPRTCLINGWSDRFLQYIPIFESEREDVLAQIKTIEPDSAVLSENGYGRKEVTKTNNNNNDEEEG